MQINTKNFLIIQLFILTLTTAKHKYMRYKLLKSLREEARKRVFIEEPEPYNWYIAINTGMRLEDNKPIKVYIVNDAPKEYINKTLAELRVNFIRYQLEKLKNEKEIL